MGTGCFKDTTIQDEKQETTKENKTKVEQNKESIKTKEISQTDTIKDKFIRKYFLDILYGLNYCSPFYQKIFGYVIIESIIF